MEAHEIIRVPIDQLVPAPYNPRVNLKPGDSDYEKLRRSMDEFGCVEPIVWNKRSGHVVSGHQRFKVLQGSGAAEVECVVVDLDDDRERALNVAMNKISGAWDEDKLRELLAQLNADFDATITGFDAEEMQALLDATRTAEQDGFDMDAALAEIETPVTQRGDIYIMGDHRLMCGDSTNDEDIARLMDGRLADMNSADPPYNVDYHGTAGSIANDSMSGSEFLQFLTDAFRLMYKHSAPGAAAYIFHADHRRKFFDVFGLVTLAGHLEHGAAPAGDFDALETGVQAVELLGHHRAQVGVGQGQESVIFRGKRVFLGRHKNVLLSLFAGLSQPDGIFFVGVDFALQPGRKLALILGKALPNKTG